MYVILIARGLFSLSDRNVDCSVGCKSCFPIAIVERAQVSGDRLKMGGPFGMCDDIDYIGPRRPWIREGVEGGETEKDLRNLSLKFQKLNNVF